MDDQSTGTEYTRSHVHWKYPALSPRFDLYPDRITPIVSYPTERVWLCEQPVEIRENVMALAAKEIGDIDAILKTIENHGIEGVSYDSFGPDEQALIDVLVSVGELRFKRDKYGMPMLFPVKKKAIFFP